MNVYRWIVIGLLTIGGAVGCGPSVGGSGNIVTDQRDIPDLQRISVCCGFHVELAEGDAPSMEITGDDNIVDAIETRRRGDTIVVDFRHNFANYHPTRPIRVDVVLTDVREFAGSAGIDLDASKIETDELQVTFSGGAQADFSQVIAERFDLQTSGGSSVEVAGDVDRQKVEVSGGGEYRGKDLSSKRAEVQASGGSRVVVRVSERLDVTASGGSNVVYYGDPEVDSETSGGSSIRKR